MPHVEGRGDGEVGSVLVAVPTFRRVDWVEELLDVLGRELRSVPSARVLVLDNDPAASAARLARHPLVASGAASLEHVGAGDVVSVRNAVLERARRCGVRALVLLDDDLLPVPGWLTALVSAAPAQGAHAVAGPVLQEPAVLRAPHAAALLVRRQRPGGAFLGDVITANVLLTADLVQLPGLRFHPDLGRSGGEDTLFFRQAASAGATFWWVPEAAAVERVAPERMTRRALLLRSYRRGRASVVVERLSGTATGPVRRLVVLLGAAAVYLPAAGLRLLRGDRVGAWDLLYRVVRHVGRVRSPADGRAGALRGGYGG